MAKGCSKLRFIFAVFFYPWHELLARVGIHYDISAIANAYYREAFAAVPVQDRAVILPHCLIGQKCKARFSKEDGVLCLCCRNCRCGEILLLCKEKGWQFYISPSSGFTKRLVQRKGIRAAIGAACDFEIVRGIRSTPVTIKGVRLKQAKVIPQLLVAARYNCLDNDIDWERLKGLIMDGDLAAAGEKADRDGGEDGASR